MSQVVVFDHPLVQHKIGILRDKETKKKEFKELVSEIAMLMTYEATKDLSLKDVEIETPLCKTTVKRIEDSKIAIVPILRTGMGMVDGILELLPNARVGHVGLYRNHESLEPVPYYCKLPNNLEEYEVLLVDPMLATGGSACQGIKFLKDNGAKNIKFLCLIAATTGVELVQKEHPDVDIYIAALDTELNEHAYIVPGLGDAGDRLYGTL